MSVKKISVELLQDIAHVGRRGDIVEVSSSQARHALIPKKLAREVTAERLKKIAWDQKRAQDQARLRKEQAFEIQKMLDGQEMSFSLKGKGGKVFGGLGVHEIIHAIHQKYGIHFEKKDVKLPGKAHIKTTGRHLVYIHITHDTLAKIFVDIILE